MTACVAALLGLGVACALYGWSVLIVACYILLLLWSVIRYEAGVYMLVLLSFVGERAIGIRMNWNPQGFFQIYDYLPLYFPLVISTFAGLMLAVSADIRKWPRDNPLKLPVFLLLAFAGMTLVTTPFLLHSGYQYFMLLMNVAIYIMVLSVLGDEAVHRRMVWLVVIWGALNAAMAFALYFFESKHFVWSYEFANGYYIESFISSGHEVFGTTAMRRGSAFQAHNALALMMNMIFPLCLGLFLFERRRLARIFLGFVMALLAAAMIITMSRAGLGSFAVMCVALFYLTRSLRPRFLTLSVAMVFIVLVAVYIETQALEAIFKRETGTPRLYKMATETSKGGIASSTERMMRWKKAYGRLTESFPAGEGVGNFKANTRVATFPHAHSMYFSFIFDFGIAGLAILAGIIYAFLRTFLPQLRYQSSYPEVMTVMFFGSFIALAIHSIVDFEYNIQFIWAFLAMAFGTAALAKRGRNSSAASS